MNNSQPNCNTFSWTPNMCSSGTPILYFAVSVKYFWTDAFQMVGMRTRVVEKVEVYHRKFPSISSYAHHHLIWLKIG